MNRSDSEMLSEVRRRLPDARKALLAGIGDMPASGTSQGTTGSSDRTGRLALGVIEGRDQAWTDNQRLDALMSLMLRRCADAQPIDRQLAEVLDICNRWAPDPKRRKQRDANLRAAADDLLNRHDDQGNCASCKRVPGAWGEPHRKGLCRTCMRHLERIKVLYEYNADLPPRELVEIGAARGKVTDRDIHTVMHRYTRRDA